MQRSVLTIIHHSFWR